MRRIMKEIALALVIAVCAAGLFGCSLGGKVNPKVSASIGHTVGLKANGRVLATGSNEYGQCNVSAWKGMTDVVAGGSHTVGLKKDGTVVAVGYNHYGQCDLSEWKDIIAISAGMNFGSSRKVRLQRKGI